MAGVRVGKRKGSRRDEREYKKEGGIDSKKEKESGGRGVGGRKSCGRKCKSGER